MESLLEFSAAGPGYRLDRARGILSGVKVLGLESRNGRTYLPEALRNAAPLYENASVNVNHPKGSPTGPRDYQDRIGRIRGVRAEATGLFGDFHFNPKHALAEQLIWDAEHAPENVGFSHNVEAKVTRKDGRVVVEEITRVQSVDLVADPATTRGLFEGVDAMAAKKALVESVADAIGMPRWAIPPLESGLAYRESREEVREYLADLLRVFDERHVLESITDGKSFARAVCGHNPDKQHDAVTEAALGRASSTERESMNNALGVIQTSRGKTFARDITQ